MKTFRNTVLILYATSLPVNIINQTCYSLAIYNIETELQYFEILSMIYVSREEPRSSLYIKRIESIKCLSIDTQVVDV